MTPGPALSTERPEPVLVVPGFSRDLHDLLSELVNRARASLEADTAAVLLVDPTGAFLDTVAASGLDLNVQQRARAFVGQGFAGIVAAERRPVTIERVTTENVTNPLLRQQGIHSLLGVPLIDRGQLLGVLHVGSLHRRVFTDPETATLQSAAEEVGNALRRALEDAELSAAATLQRSLVPDALPDLPGLELAARYIPAEGHLGGDWYDVFPLPGDRVGIVIGDVAGHGLRAAIIMGRLRSALRAYALEHEDPAEVLSRLDAKISHFEAGVFATALYGVSRRPFDEVSFSSAGHLPPLLRPRGGTAAFAEVKPDLPLGLGLDEPRHATTVACSPGTTLALFTDGLVERRPPNLTSSSLQELGATLGAGPLETLASTVVETMFYATRPEDDATLLLLRRVGR